MRNRLASLLISLRPESSAKDVADLVSELASLLGQQADSCVEFPIVNRLKGLTDAVRKSG
jgi:hypothetical protein